MSLFLIYTRPHPDPREPREGDRELLAYQKMINPQSRVAQQASENSPITHDLFAGMEDAETVSQPLCE
ncbi:MAG: hypothetical protein JO076_15980 [Verrucomicrobia bacterium]|nr:hypothetical protein [Verrucomicrobiota bacterium]